MNARRLRAPLALCALLLAPPAQARPHALNAQERAQIEGLLRAWFEGVRDGNTANIVAQQPTADEWRQIFQPGTEELWGRQIGVLARDARELRERFADGQWIGLAAPWATQRSIDVDRCGRFGREQSECSDGPVLEWRARGEVRRLRIDRLVRVGNRWRLFDARL